MPLQLQAGLLDEICLALQALKQGGFLTAGIASVISCHIQYSLAEEDEELPKPVFLEHIQLLGLEPLRALLDFLWMQLGLRWSVLPQLSVASELLQVRLIG